MVAVEARYGPNVIIESHRPIAGYFQTFGVTGNSESEIIDRIREFIRTDQGSTMVEVSEMWVPDFEGADSDIKELIGDIDKPGIWYSSGHAMFWDDDQENEKV
jgi:hypothetical protein